MTKEEAITRIKSLMSCGAHHQLVYFHSLDFEALEMAVRALEEIIKSEKFVRDIAKEIFCERDYKSILEGESDNERK